MKIDMRELKELYDKRDRILQEVGLLLEDVNMLREIGNKTFIEYEREVLEPAIRLFSFGNHPKEVWKYRGHRVSLIRYYCDMFNTKEPDVEKIYKKAD